MKLPKRDLPTYTTTLPVSGIEVQYRPYTVKEERILTMASSNEKPELKDVQAAIRQVIENCANIDASKLSDADFEYIFLKLVGASVGKAHQIVIQKTCGLEGCPGEHPAGVNLDEVVVRGIDSWEESGKFSRRGELWIIQFDENSGIAIRPTFSRGKLEDTIFESFAYYYDEDNVYDEFTREEWDSWLECLTSADMKTIRSFFDASPYCSISVETKCRKCSQSVFVETKGVLDFLE